MYSMTIKFVRTCAFSVLNEYRFSVYVLDPRAPSPVQTVIVQSVFINEM